MDGPKTPVYLRVLADHPGKHATPRPVRPWWCVAWWRAIICMGST